LANSSYIFGCLARKGEGQLRYKKKRSKAWPEEKKEEYKLEAGNKMNRGFNKVLTAAP